MNPLGKKLSVQGIKLAEPFNFEKNEVIWARR